MKLGELLTILVDKSGSEINQSDLAQSLGITRQTVSNRIKNGSEVTVSEFDKVEKFFNVRLNMTPSFSENSVIVMDYYPEVFVSCGLGAITFSEEKYPMVISKDLVSNYSDTKNYSVIIAKGDSMQPFINSNDKLIIEQTETNAIEDNKVYVFCYKQELFVKRLSKNIDEIVIKSDNPEYRTRIISLSDIPELIILGKVVGLLRNEI